MESLLPLATKIAGLLTARGETVAVAESSTGGLIATSLVAVPGASAYFLGGAVIYTHDARRALLGFPDVTMSGMRPSTESYATLLAVKTRLKFKSSWAIGETGASGPTGNRYGDKPGHSCCAVSGLVERARTIETGQADRAANMRAFALAALEQFAACLA